MQADLGSAVSDAGAFVGYTYGARYVYTDTVILNDNFLRVSACEDAYQTPLTSAVITVPATRPVQYKDRMGNPTHRVRLSSPHRDLTILAVGSVRLDSPPSALEEVALANLRYDASADEFLSSTPMVHPNMVADMARQIIGGNAGDPVGNGAGLLETVDGIVSWVYENITYIRGSTTVATTAEQVLGTRQGVCQDMTHLAMGMLRALGIPARYVSGLMCGQVRRDACVAGVPASYAGLAAFRPNTRAVHRQRRRLSEVRRRSGLYAGVAHRRVVRVEGHGLARCGRGAGVARPPKACRSTTR